MYDFIDRMTGLDVGLFVPDGGYMQAILFHVTCSVEHEHPHF